MTRFRVTQAGIRVLFRCSGSRSRLLCWCPLTLLPLFIKLASEKRGTAVTASARSGVIGPAATDGLLTTVTDPGRRRRLGRSGRADSEAVTLVSEAKSQKGCDLEVKTVTAEEMITAEEKITLTDV